MKFRFVLVNFYLGKMKFDPFLANLFEKRNLVSCFGHSRYTCLSLIKVSLFAGRKRVHSPSLRFELTSFTTKVRALKVMCSLTEHLAGDT